MLPKVREKFGIGLNNIRAILKDITKDEETTTRLILSYLEKRS